MCNARVFISPRVRVASSASAAATRRVEKSSAPLPSVVFRSWCGRALPAGPIVFIGAAVSLTGQTEPVHRVRFSSAFTDRNPARAIRIACIYVVFQRVKLTDAGKPSIHGSFSVARADS